MPAPAKASAAAKEVAQDLPPPRFTLQDKLMILLAFASAILVIADIWFRPRLIFENIPGHFFQPAPAGWSDPNTNTGYGGPALRPEIYGLHPYWWLVIIDLLITFVFAIEFVTSAREYGSFKGYAKANWFDLAGMFPMALFVAIDYYAFGCNSVTLLAGCQAAEGLGIVRFLRFARIIRILVTGSRLSRAVNMTFGEQVTKRLFHKYRAVLVAELTTPILIQAITITQAIVTRGRYAESVGVELDKKRDEIHALIIKNLEAKKATRPLIEPEFVRAAILRAEKEVLDTVVLTLTSEELNKIIQDTLDRVLTDFKSELKKKEWAHIALAPELEAEREKEMGNGAA